MKIGSLVRVRADYDEDLSGKIAIVLGRVQITDHVYRVMIISDGWTGDFHSSRLEMMCESR